jgi:ribosomal protein S25
MLANDEMTDSSLKSGRRISIIERIKKNQRLNEIKKTIKNNPNIEAEELARRMNWSITTTYSYLKILNEKGILWQLEDLNKALIKYGSPVRLNIGRSRGYFIVENKNDIRKVAESEANAISKNYNLPFLDVNKNLQKIVPDDFSVYSRASLRTAIRNVGEWVEPRLKKLREFVKSLNN